MTQLSPHFSLEELTATSHRELDNTPPPEVVDNLRHTAAHMEGIRADLGGRAIHVNSGFRSPAVNAAVGGVADSAHLTGWAVDFICPDFGTPLEICRKLAGDFACAFDQLIQEGSWVHISFAPGFRREVLTKAPGGGYRPGLPS